MANIPSWLPARSTILHDARLESIIRMGQGAFVYSGCLFHEVTPQSKSIIIDAGVIYYNFAAVSCAGATLDISPYIDTVYPALHIIYIDTSGVPQVHEGIPAVTNPDTASNWKEYESPAPKTSTLPVGVPLCLLYTDANEITIIDADMDSIAIVIANWIGASTAIPSDILVPTQNVTVPSGATKLIVLPQGKGLGVRLANSTYRYSISGSLIIAEM